MAFKQAESSSSGALPFFNDWIKTLFPNEIEFFDGKMMTPKKIKAVESGKGFMLNFDDEFSLFVWKKSSPGSIIKKMIDTEQGNLLLIQFVETKRGLTYELGFDDEIEVALIEDKFNENVYYQEETTENTIPIAPNDYRKFIMSLPLISPPVPTKLSPTPSSKPKSKQRSDGEG